MDASVVSFPTMIRGVFEEHILVLLISEKTRNLARQRTGC